MKRLIFGMALIFAAVPFCCGQEISWRMITQLVRSTFPEAKQLSTAALAHWLGDTSRTQPVLLDARNPYEFKVSHLKNAVSINPELQDFSGLSLSKQTPVVVYCSVGYRSAKVVSRMQKAGFTNVQNLEGSIFKWKNEGRPVYRNDREVQEVHPYDQAWGVLLKRAYRSYQARN
ncbi:MAG: rhodanese-like domain-containing protein [Bacteroidetes Order II. Incertae sedis bacterium]|nr:rhodanese-like domain-containing protein [Bacteroidetes Order II. bacterium]